MYSMGWVLIQRYRVWQSIRVRTGLRFWWNYLPGDISVLRRVRCPSDKIISLDAKSGLLPSKAQLNTAPMPQPMRNTDSPLHNSWINSFTTDCKSISLRSADRIFKFGQTKVKFSSSRSRTWSQFRGLSGKSWRLEFKSWWNFCNQKIRSSEGTLVYDTFWYWDE